MRVRPRLSFAAPFVMVLGCRRPIAELEPPEPQDAATTASITDAIALLDHQLEPDAPPDAAPRDPVVIDCNDPRSHCTHNPPSLEYCADHPELPRCPPLPASYCSLHPDKAGCRTGCTGTTCNPPAPIVTRVLQVNIISDEVVVVAGAGSNQGVSKTSTGRFINDADKPVPGGDLVIVRVEARTSLWRAHLTPDRVKMFPRIRITVE